MAASSSAHGSSPAAAWDLPVDLLPPQLTPNSALGFSWCYRRRDRVGYSVNPDTGAELKKQENSPCKEAAHRAECTSHVPFTISPC